MPIQSARGAEAEEEDLHKAGVGTAARRRETETRRRVCAEGALHQPRYYSSVIHAQSRIEL